MPGYSRGFLELIHKLAEDILCAEVGEEVIFPFKDEKMVFKRIS